MAETNVIRAATEAEKQDFVEIGTPNALGLFLERLSQKEQKCLKKYIPFDSYSARIEFEDKIRRIMGDIDRAVSPTERAKIEKKLNISDKELDEYAKPDRFELVKVEEVKEDKLLDGIRQPTVVGKRFFFKGKLRGNGFAMFVPNKALTEVEARYASDIKEVKE